MKVVFAILVGLVLGMTLMVSMVVAQDSNLEGSETGPADPETGGLSAAAQSTCIGEFWDYNRPHSIFGAFAVTQGDGDRPPIIQMILDDCVGWGIYQATTVVNTREGPTLGHERVGRLREGEEIHATCGFEGQDWGGSDNWCLAKPGYYVHRNLLEYIGLAETLWDAYRAAPAQEETEDEG